MVSREYGVSKHCRKSRKCVAWGARERCAQDGAGASAGARWCRAQSAVVEHFYHVPWKTLEGSGEGWLARVVLLGGEGQDRHMESCLETVNLLLLV